MIHRAVVSVIFLETQAIRFPIQKAYTPLDLASSGSYNPHCFDLWSFFAGVTAPTTCGLLFVLNYMSRVVFIQQLWSSRVVFIPNSQVR